MMVMMSGILALLGDENYKEQCEQALTYEDKDVVMKDERKPYIETKVLCKHGSHLVTLWKT